MLSASGHTAVLYCETPAANDNNAREFAEFLGADVATVDLAPWAGDAGSVLRNISAYSAIIVSAETLIRVAEVLEAGVEGLLALTGPANHWFVYGFQPTDRHASLLRTLSSGVLLGLETPPPDAVFSVSAGQRKWFGPLSGVPVPGADAARDACFIEGEARSGKTVLVRVADRPFFVRVDRGKSHLFFSACHDVADLGEEVPSAGGLVPWFSRFVPLTAFLKIALGNRLWHAASSQACFIIDDPLLKPRYGSLDYLKLLESMACQKFSISIAFIPWNYRRSRKRVVDLFSAHPSSLSLCVHGCDHTGAEFAAAPVEQLRQKASLALARMRGHRDLSGLPFDEVMVFPQGLFSSAALEALESCGYLAAVNTSLCPSNAPRGLTLKDLLSVTVTRFGGVPLFARHYPRDVAEFALDLFIGKPALVVEHHGYFRNGYAEIADFVRQLNELDAHLEWSRLATICSCACLQRVMPNGVVHVRFYTNRFQFVNRGDRPTTYSFSLPWAADRPLPDVTLNGREWVREPGGGRVATTLSLDPGQAVEGSILRRSSNAIDPYWNPANTGRAKVLLRRVLSEFRDNHVDTNAVLAGLLSSTRKLRTRGRLLLRRQSVAEVETAHELGR